MSYTMSYIYIVCDVISLNIVYDIAYDIVYDIVYWYRIRHRISIYRIRCRIRYRIRCLLMFLYFLGWGRATSSQAQTYTRECVLQSRAWVSYSSSGVALASDEAGRVDWCQSFGRTADSRQDCLRLSSTLFCSTTWFGVCTVICARLVVSNGNVICLTGDPRRAAIPSTSTVIVFGIKTLR